MEKSRPGKDSVNCMLNYVLMHLLLKLGRHSLNICSLKLKHMYIKTTEEVEHFATEFVFSLLPFEDKGCANIVRNT